MGVYFEDRGGEGVPILLIHLAGATASTWGPVVDDLATRGRLMTYDRRGYGRTGGALAGSIAAHTEDAADLLEALQCPPAIVFGISVAATIAIDVGQLLCRPDLVRAVVAHESPWRVTRQPPTPSQFVRLPRCSGDQHAAVMPTRWRRSCASRTRIMTGVRHGTDFPMNGVRSRERMRCLPWTTSVLRLATIRRAEILR